MLLIILALLIGVSLADGAWRELDREELDPQQRHTLVFAARQSERGLRALEEVVLGSRGFLSRRQVAALTDHEAASLAIERYLRTRGVSVDRRSRFGEYIHASATIAQWEDILKARFTPLTDGESRIHRTSSLLVPGEIRPHVSHVLYSTETGPRNRRKAVRSAPVKRSLRSSSLPVVTPALINRLYNITSNVCDDRATQAVYAGLGQNFSPDDVDDFLDQQGFEDVISITVEGGHHNGSLCSSDADLCSEGNLDVEYMLSIW